MGEHFLGTGAARNSLDGHVYLFICVLNADQKQPDFFSRDAFEGEGGLV